SSVPFAPTVFNCGSIRAGAARRKREQARATPADAADASYHAWRAEVAELADAPDSKSGSLRGGGVRFPPSALACLARRAFGPARAAPTICIRGRRMKLCSG